MPRTLRLLAVLLVALPAASAAPARAAPASRELSLRFSCPDGARVTWTSDEESSIGRGAATRRKRAGRARVSRDAETCRVELETAPDGDAPAPPLALLAGAEDGAFLRWEGAEAWLAAAAQTDAEVRGAAPGARDPASAVVEDAGDEDGEDGSHASPAQTPPATPPGSQRAPGDEGDLTPGPREAEARADLAREEEVWRETVARWADKTAIPGRTSEETRSPAAGAPGAPPLRVRWAIRRRLPCPGERRRRCVELWARASPDEDVLRRACSAPRPADEARSPRHVVRELVVVAAPDDLLPRRARLESTSRPACPGAGPPASTERWQRTWTWEPR